MDRERRKLWTKKEIFQLYQLAERFPLASVGKQLGRSREAIKQKARGLGIQLCRGKIGISQLASELNCSVHAIRRALYIFYDPTEIHKVGSGVKTRYWLTEEQADKIRRIITATRKYRRQQIEAGRKGGLKNAKSTRRSEGRASQ